MSKLNKMREQMIDEFVKALEEDKIPWRRGWQSGGKPENAVTGKPYNGVNKLWLHWCEELNMYADNRWCTFKQAASKGWKIKKGEKGTQIEFWSIYDKKEKMKLTWDEVAKLRNSLSKNEFDRRVCFIDRLTTVFNAEQIEGIPEKKIERYIVETETLVEKRNTLIRNMGVGFREGGGHAFYQPYEDCIVLPKVKDFISEYAYLSTFLHEAGHATGHESRFNRDFSGSFGSVAYAKEELRAEIASAFTSQALGIDAFSPEHIENHKAYIQSWIATLHKEPQELFRAIKDAEKISDYLIEKGEFVLVKEEELEKRLAVMQERKEPGIEQNMDEFHLVQRVAEMEKKLDIPPEKCLTEWFGDYAMYERKMGVSLLQLEERYAEFQKYDMPLFSIQEAASLRLIAKGKPIKNDSQNPLYVKTASVIEDYLKEGLTVNEVLTGKIEEIAKRAEISDIRFAKNLACSLYANDRESYESYMGFKKQEKTHEGSEQHQQEQRKERSIEIGSRTR